MDSWLIIPDPLEEESRELQMQGQPESLSETLSQMKSTKSCGIAQRGRTYLGCSSEGLVAQLGRAPRD